MSVVHLVYTFVSVSDLVYCFFLVSEQCSPLLLSPTVSILEIILTYIFSRLDMYAQKMFIWWDILGCAVPSSKLVSWLTVRRCQLFAALWWPWRLFFFFFSSLNCIGLIILFQLSERFAHHSGRYQRTHWLTGLAVGQFVLNWHKKHKARSPTTIIMMQRTISLAFKVYMIKLRACFFSQKLR